MELLLVLAVLFTGFSLTANIIAVAIPYWLYSASPNEDYQGLWQRCSSNSNNNGGNTNCVFLAMQPEFVDSTRVMMLLGMIMYTFSVLAGFTYTFIKTQKSRLGTAATVLVFIGSLFCIISVIIYASRYTILLSPPDRKLHAGFGLAVISAIGGIASGFVYCMAHARGDIE